MTANLEFVTTLITKSFGEKTFVQNVQYFGQRFRTDFKFEKMNFIDENKRGFSKLRIQNQYQERNSNRLDH